MVEVKRIWCAVLMFMVLLVAPAQAAKPLAFTVHNGHSVKRCAHGFAGGRVAIWVYVDGREIHSVNGREFYWAGQGAAVGVTSGRSWLCARAMTWRRAAHVKVRLVTL